MSSWDDIRCPYCGARYGGVRTGLDYMAVYAMLHSPSDDPRAWRYRHRNAVLGAWHAIKLELWREHLAMCEAMAEAAGTGVSTIAIEINRPGG